ncbi:MAG: FGGY-family carbohydrate kinase [Propylenella sp.]
MATMTRHVAAIDIGKTNARATLVRGDDFVEVAQLTAANRVVSDGPYPHFDVALLWGFLCGALSELNREAPVDAISVTAHGSAGAFLSRDEEGDGLALPILDYEFAGPDELSAEYDAARPDFSESLSPRLPGGLNLGAQIFWQERRFPDAVRKAASYVNYPQYWAWRLSGVAATEMCSMGAHSDLWDPRRLTWSSLVTRMKWAKLFAPLRPASDRLGAVKPALAARLGLDPKTSVLCGIHDSSASLLPHLLTRKPPFTVVSTGTWTILFAVGGSLDRLDPARDTLANVTAFGDPVPCGRFMGGREFERLVGANPAEPSDGELRRVIGERVMALPTFVPGVGPFPQRKGSWTHAPDTLAAGERTAAASLYLALMTAESMACAGADGPTVIEGPMMANRIFCAALAAITGRPVLPSQSAGGTTRGAAALLDMTKVVAAEDEQPVAPLAHQAFGDYVKTWRAKAAA